MTRNSPPTEQLLEEAVRLLAEWACAVEYDSSWDGWDHFYKQVMYGQSPLRGLLDAEIKRIQERDAQWRNS